MRFYKIYTCIKKNKVRFYKIYTCIKNNFLDSDRELFQIFSLLICLLTPTFINLSEIIKFVFGDEKITFDNAKYYYLMNSGDWTIGVLMALYILINVIRKSNKEKVFNRKNFYHSKPYCWYWFCSKILGYEKCNLILVPIYTQFKLILRGTFEEYPFDEGIFPKTKCKIKVKKIIKNTDKKNVNLIIEDTYKIELKQIPIKLIKNNTIIIQRVANRIGERVYSEKLIEKVIEEVRNLEENITLNIFATTNPRHTYEIARKAIALGERSNIKHVNVFQQESYGERNFSDKTYKII